MSETISPFLKLRLIKRGKVTVNTLQAMLRLVSGLAPVCLPGIFCIKPNFDFFALRLLKCVDRAIIRLKNETREEKADNKSCT